VATAESVLGWLGGAWVLTHAALTVSGAWDHQAEPVEPATGPIRVPTQPLRRVIVVPAYPPAVPA
jgi:hypothetical protein